MGATWEEQAGLALLTGIVLFGLIGLIIVSTWRK
jgi:hypothetical protein